MTLFKTVNRVTALLLASLPVAKVVVASPSYPRDCIVDKVSFSTAQTLGIQSDCYQRIVQQLEMNCERAGFGGSVGLCQSMKVSGACILAIPGEDSSHVGIYFDFPRSSDFGYDISIINKLSCQFTFRGIRVDD